MLNTISYKIDLSFDSRNASEEESSITSREKRQTAKLQSNSNNNKLSVARPKFASTQNLKELIIGRCYEYMFNRGIDDAPSKPASATLKLDCGVIWSKLFEAFSYKGPCGATQQDYESLLQLMQENVPKDKVKLSF